MNDIHQIELITNSLLKEKEKYLFELEKINTSIKNKLSMIDKMKSYQDDYLNNSNLMLSKSIPVLHKNINFFVKRINVVISQAESEISSLGKMKISILESVEKINRKIDLMDVFAKKSKSALKMQEEKREQNTLDDLSSTIKQRESEYE